MSERKGCGACDGRGYLPTGAKCRACRGVGLAPETKPTAKKEGGRTKVYTLRLTPDEWSDLRQAAQLIGVPIAEWIRTCALRESRDVIAGKS